MKEDEMSGTCSTNGEGGGEERVYVIGGKARGKENTRKTKTEVVDNIKKDLGEMGGVDWIGLAQDRGQVESSCECGDEPSGSMKCWKTIVWLHNWWPLE
jgi:hypothetical protein